VSEQKLNRVVIKEELVELTGDFIKAVLLNQFIYWSERVKDFDKFIQEERSRVENDGKELNIDLQNGWIYKKSEELSKETMLNMTAKSIRNHVKELVNRGFLSERTNPKFKWDKTMQYRVNLTKIQDELYKINYHLEGYKVSIYRSENISVQEVKNTLQRVENYAAIPETISETTSNNIYIPYKEIIEHLNLKVGTNYKHSSKSTQKHIHARWEEGHRLEDFIKVIDNKVVDWLDDAKYSKYLRPETLFGTKFESYLNKPKATQSVNTQPTNRSDLKQLASNDDPEYLEFLRIEREKEAQRKLGVTGY